MKRALYKLLFFVLFLFLLGGVLLVGCNDGSEPPVDPCAAGHAFGESYDVVAASCTEDGSAKQKCLHCEAVRTVVLSATGHDAGEWITVTEPTGLDVGLRRKTCSNCAIELETETIPALGEAACEVAHTEGEWRRTPGIAACAESIDRLHCAVCDAVMDTRTVPAVATHTLGAYIRVLEPSCTSEGREERACLTCGVLLGKRALPALAHEMDKTWSEPDETALCVRTCRTCSLVMEKAYLRGRAYQSPETVHVALSDYGITYYDTVHASYASDVFTGAVNDFAAALTARTLHTFTPTTEGEDTAREILIGATSRAESMAAMAELEGYGWLIRVTEDKIVIVGSSDLFVMEALEYFLAYFVTGDEIALPVSARSFNRSVLPIGVGTTLVYDRNTDTDTANEYGAVGSNSISGGGVDYTYYMAQQIYTLVKDTTGYRIAMGTDETVREHEVLIGRMDRPETAACLAILEGNEHGFFVYGGKLVVISPSAAGMQAVWPLLRAYLSEAVGYNEAGTLSVAFPTDTDFRMTEVTNEAWIMDFPRPDAEGISLYNTMDNEDDSLQFLYTGEGISADAYRAYCDTLRAAGYEQLTHREAAGNLFTLLVHRERAHALYVAYHAFAFAEHTDWAYKHPMLRVISMPVNEHTVPPSELLSPPEYVKVTDSSLTALGLTSYGTGYVILLEDGSFVILDGGQAYAEDATNLYNVLSDLHEQAWGNKPDKNDPVHIRAWIISHSHGDHYGVYNKFSVNYAAKGLATMDYFLYSKVGPSNLYNTGEANVYVTTYMSYYQGFWPSKPTYIKVHTGVPLYFAGLEIETLYTHEDLNPARIVTHNDTSTVQRLILTPSEGGTEGEPVSIVWTGDAYRYSGFLMRAAYGAYLKSDMVMISHHGGAGLDYPFYALVNASTVWYPSTGQGPSSMYFTGNEDFIYYSNRTFGDTKNYENVTIFFTIDGPDHARLYSAAYGTWLAYDNKSRIDCKGVYAN